MYNEHLAILSRISTAAARLGVVVPEKEQYTFSQINVEQSPTQPFRKCWNGHSGDYLTTIMLAVEQPTTSFL